MFSRKKLNRYKREIEQLSSKNKQLEKENKELKTKVEEGYHTRRTLGLFLYDFSQSLRDNSLDIYHLSESQYKLLYQLSLILRTHNDPNEKLGEIYELTKLLEKEGITNPINPYIAWFNLLEKNWKDCLQNKEYHNSDSPMVLDNRIKKVDHEDKSWSYERIA